MSITDASIIHHVCIVLALLWLLSLFNCCHPVAFFASLIYLYQVHERYVMKLRRKLQFEERKQANQRRVLSDSETVRWLNHAVEKIWPLCMEQILSQIILLPIIPWFLEKYKPWTAKKAVVQSLYMGRTPPIFTEMRVCQSTDDDHLVLQIGMNFLAADDMSAILAVKLRRRLGFGMWTKLHLTGMQIEGKILIGVKFLRRWPFLGRLRVCFAEPPYFQMTVKPISTYGLDVTELPGIAGWLDKLLGMAFEQTLVEPNMLVIDVEKFVSPELGSWFSVDEKVPVAYAMVEIIEAANIKPSDLNGLADPYVKGRFGLYRFRTKIQWKTLAPKWQEEFKIPIFTWELSNVLAIEVHDKDHFVDDSLGNCSININDLRDGHRHDMWLSLQNIKMGRLHLAITVFEVNEKEEDKPWDGKTLNEEDRRNSFASETSSKGFLSSISPEESSKLADKFEPIEIEGQQETGVWVQHPGSDVSQSWEPRKGKSRIRDNHIHRETADSSGNPNAAASASFHNDSSSADENQDEKLRRLDTVRKGLHKIGSVFHRSPRSPRMEDQSVNVGEGVPSPNANLNSLNSKKIGVTFVLEDSLSEPPIVGIPISGGISSSGGSSPESLSKGNVKDKAKSFLKHAGRSARSIKHVLTRKGSSRSGGDHSGLVVTSKEIPLDSESSSDESRLSSGMIPSVEVAPIVEKLVEGAHVNDSSNSTEHIVQAGDIPRVEMVPIVEGLKEGDHANYSLNSKEHIVQTDSNNAAMKLQDSGNKVSSEAPTRKENNSLSRPEVIDDGLVSKSSNTEVSSENSE